MMLFRVNVYAFVASYILLLVKATHTVIVGSKGPFYNPAVIYAQQNETIVFEFAGDFHSVTQSSFDDPCTPLPGGFDSGIAGAGATAPIPSWALVITNASAPIWFFCTVVQPSSFCHLGMVGVINPYNTSMYNKFAALAKVITGTPAPTNTIILTGQGAYATNSPSGSLVPQDVVLTTSTTATATYATNSLAPSTSSPPITTSSTSSTSTSASSSSTSQLGAIIAGALAGTFAIIGLIIILWLFWLRKKKAAIRHETENFDYNTSVISDKNTEMTLFQPLSPNPNK